MNSKLFQYVTLSFASILYSKFGETAKNHYICSRLRSKSRNTLQLLIISHLTEEVWKTQRNSSI